MRSRYTAFVTGNVPYLNRTAPAHPIRHLSSMRRRWLGLEILSSEMRQTEGWVAFRARYIEDNVLTVHTEKSYFQCLGGNWQYVSGEPDFHQWSIARNETCPCGSGKKFKRCCAT